MSNLEQDELNLTSETASGNPGQGRFGRKLPNDWILFWRTLSKSLDSWAAATDRRAGLGNAADRLSFSMDILNSSAGNSPQKSSYFLYYFQSRVTDQPQMSASPLLLWSAWTWSKIGWLPSTAIPLNPIKVLKNTHTTWIASDCGVGDIGFQPTVHCPEWWRPGRQSSL